MMCFRNRLYNKIPTTDNLPQERVTPFKPFLKTRVDFAGPFHIKIHTVRNTKEVKVYLCIFVCFSNKAVHLEVAMDLTEAYIDALIRFTS